METKPLPVTVTSRVIHNNVESAAYGRQGIVKEITNGFALVHWQKAQDGHDIQFTAHTWVAVGELKVIPAKQKPPKPSNNIPL